MGVSLEEGGGRGERRHTKILGGEKGSAIALFLPTIKGKRKRRRYSFLETLSHSPKEEEKKSQRLLKTKGGREPERHPATERVSFVEGKKRNGERTSFILPATPRRRKAAH